MHFLIIQRKKGIKKKERGKKKPILNTITSGMYILIANSHLLNVSLTLNESVIGRSSIFN